MKRWAIVLVAASLVLVGGRSALGWLLEFPLAERLSTRWIAPDAPPPAPAPAQDRERTALRTLGRQVSGTLVWSSNRGGNHDLYRAELSTGELTRLTTHPHVDYFSRFSPDRRSISFLRSQRPWVSFRESGGWDLFVMNADGSGERRLAERAFHPMWTPDGREITFRRDNQVVAVDVQSGRERVLHDGADPPTRGDIGDPMLGPDGAIVLSLRGVSRSRRGVGILAPGGTSFTRVSASSSACHIFWIADGRRVVWIEGSGRGGTQVMHTPAPGADAEVLIDLPGDYSHEYFPRITRDGRWLVWGAAAEGHEHDRADYEIFAWRLGTPWDAAIRLTYSASNDQWPDLDID